MQLVGSQVSLNQSAARHLRTVASGELDLYLTTEWLRDLLEEKGAEIFRVKGVLAVAHAERRCVCRACAARSLRLVTWSSSLLACGASLAARGVFACSW